MNLILCYSLFCFIVILLKWSRAWIIWNYLYKQIFGYSVIFCFVLFINLFVSVWLCVCIRMILLLVTGNRICDMVEEMIFLGHKYYILHCDCSVTRARYLVWANVEQPWWLWVSLSMWRGCVSVLSQRIIMLGDTT